MKNIKDFIFESNIDIEDIESDLSEWWEERINIDGYNNRREYERDVKLMSNGNNDELVNVAIDALIVEYKWPKNEINKFRNDITNILTQLAKDKLKKL